MFMCCFLYTEFFVCLIYPGLGITLIKYVKKNSTDLLFARKTSRLQVSAYSTETEMRTREKH